MDQSIQKELGTNERKNYSGIPMRILKLLGSGLLPVEVARAVGVDESYISQLQKEESFAQQVNELIVKTFAEQSEIDNNYIEIEKILSKRLRDNASIMFNQDTILRTLKFANEAKKKIAPALVTPGNGSNGSGTTINGPVTLILPAAVVKEFILNPNNEIIGIGNEELTTLPSANINKLVRETKENLKNLPSVKIIKNGPRQVDPYSDL
jgi:hypothetical protein